MAAPDSAPAPRRRRLALRVLAGIVLLLVVVALAGGIWFYSVARSAVPQMDGTLNVPGLKERVVVVRDAYGVPHVTASSLEDLFFAQGYVTAQERLWQLDATRRFAAGELSEILGDGFLEQDRRQRILISAMPRAEALRTLPPDELAHFEAFTRGVNAFIDSGHALPLEFRILRYQPRRWKVEDSLLVQANMVQVLTNRGLQQDITYEKVLEKLGPELTAQLYPRTSPRDRIPGVDLAPTALAARPARPAPPLADFPAGFPLLEEEALFPGSNNWAVSGAHTTTGKPMLANDMHLPHRIPNVWFEMHLMSGDFDVAGVTLPGVPFVIAGHNRRIGWGFTNLGADVQDLYVETFNDAGNYLTPAGWQEPQRKREVIRVKGKPDVTVDIVITRNGPIVTDLMQGERRKLALKWILYDRTALLPSFYRLNHAGNWEEFRAALRQFGVPTLNTVYADVDGNIGYQAIGFIPIRAAGDGSVPVSGHDDRHAWTGFVPFDAMPSVFNPPSGIVATANSRIVPDAYPFFVTSEWVAPYRTERIYQVLASGKKFSAADMLALQMDIHSDFDRYCAQQFAAAVTQIEKSSARARLAGDILRAWDGEVTADSIAPTLVARARRELWRLLLEPKLGSESSTGLSWRSYNWWMSGVALEKMLSERPAVWLPQRYTSYDELLVEALEAALRTDEAPRDLNQWRFGTQFPVDIRHPIFGTVAVFNRWTGTGIRPQSGNGNTVKQVGRTFGPSQRFTIDFADLDASTANIVTGQSGHLLSPHYMDHWPAWYEGRSFPFPFSAGVVARAKTHELILEPAR